MRDPGNLNQEPLSLEETGKRGQGVLDSDLPFLVAGMEGKIIGYTPAYTNVHTLRPTCCDSGDSGSTGLHKCLGFRYVSVLHAAVFKPGRWVDTVMVQRPLSGIDKPFASQDDEA